MREGGPPWLLRSASGTSLVLRTGGYPGNLATEVAALRLTGAHGLPVPRVVAVDLDRPAVLTTALLGTSRTSGPPSPTRFRAIGAAAAAVHRLPAPPPSPELPVRTRPIPGVDFAALRRAEPVSPLLAAAEEALDHMPPPPSLPVFVHGDLWQGNLLWDGDTLTGIVDWDCAGVGPAGIDVGALRCDAATSTGAGAPEDVLAGYEQAAGGPLDDVAYWDVVAALATPPTMGWFVDAVRDQGRTDLDGPTVLARRDSFLEAALRRL